MEVQPSHSEASDAWSRSHRRGFGALACFSYFTKRHNPLRRRDCIWGHLEAF